MELKSCPFCENVDKMHEKTINDLISRGAAIAEIEEYIEEYSELEPETGYHNLKWCAMEEAKDVLSMLPSVDAIPMEWLRGKMTKYYSLPLNPFAWVLREWLEEQEANNG